MSETTQSVSENPQSPTVDAAIDAFLNRWEDSPKKETSENTSDEGAAETTEVSEEYEEVVEADEGQDEIVESEEIDLEEQVEETEEVEYVDVVDDDFLTTIKVGEDELEVSVKDLKRLYGQEKALTQKSQQVAEQRKALEAEQQKNAVILQTLIGKAEEKLKPYAEIDMLLASKQMEADEFAQLRKEAQAAYEDYTFLNQEADQYLKLMQSAQKEQTKEKAALAIETLAKEIPDWSEKLYDDIRQYGVSQGLTQNDVDQLVDPNAIKIMLKAMRFDQGKKVAVKKKTLAPRRVLKSGATKPVNGKQRVTKQAMENLAKSGSTDAAKDAFLARWTAN